MELANKEDIRVQYDYPDIEEMHRETRMGASLLSSDLVSSFRAINKQKLETAGHKVGQGSENCHCKPVVKKMTFSLIVIHNELPITQKA